MPRPDDFKGTRDDYEKYLEDTVENLREQLHRQSHGTKVCSTKGVSITNSDLVPDEEPSRDLLPAVAITPLGINPPASVAATPPRITTPPSAFITPVPGVVPSNVTQLREVSHGEEVAWIHQGPGSAFSDATQLCGAHATTHTKSYSRKRVRQDSDQAHGDLKLISHAFDVDRRRGPDRQWLEPIQNLIKLTPSAGRWWTHLKQSGLHDILSSGAAVSDLLGDAADFRSGPYLDSFGYDAEPVPPDRLSGRTKEVLARLTRSASLAKERAKVFGRRAMFANFERIVVLSACAVLTTMLWPKKEVMKIARLCFNNASDDYCSRMIKVAVLLNQMIDHLDTNGWDAHATELLLVWDKSPTFFRRFLSASTDSVDYLREHLPVPDFSGSVHSENLGLSLFIPIILQSMFGGHFQLILIGGCLQYKHTRLLANGGDFKTNPWILFAGCGGFEC